MALKKSLSAQSKLKKCQSICLPDGNGAQNWRLFHDVAGLPRSVYGTSEACLRHTWGLSAVLPGTQLTCYRGHACGICELGFTLLKYRLTKVSKEQLKIDEKSLLFWNITIFLRGGGLITFLHGWSQSCPRV